VLIACFFLYLVLLPVRDLRQFLMKLSIVTKSLLHCYRSKSFPLAKILPSQPGTSTPFVRKTGAQ